MIGVICSIFSFYICHLGQCPHRSKDWKGVLFGGQPQLLGHGSPQLDITLCRHRLLLFVKYLTMRVLTWKCRLRQYTDCWQNVGEQEMFLCDKRSLSENKTAEIMAMRLRQHNTVARIKYCHWFLSFVRERIYLRQLGFVLKGDTLYKLEL